MSVDRVVRQRSKRAAIIPKSVQWPNKIEPTHRVTVVCQRIQRRTVVFVLRILRFSDLASAFCERTSPEIQTLMSNLREDHIRHMMRTDAEGIGIVVPPEFAEHTDWETSTLQCAMDAILVQVSNLGRVRPLRIFFETARKCQDLEKAAADLVLQKRSNLCRWKLAGVWLERGNLIEWEVDCNGQVTRFGEGSEQTRVVEATEMIYELGGKSFSRRFERSGWILDMDRSTLDYIEWIKPAGLQAVWDRTS